MALNIVQGDYDESLTRRSVLGGLGKVAMVTAALAVGAPVFADEPRSSSAPTVEEVAPQVEYLTQAEVQRQYEAGFNHIMTGVGANFDPENNSDDVVMTWLEIVNTFYRSKVEWITDLSQAVDPKKGYIYVYPKENPAAFDGKLTLEVDTNPGVKVLKIKPVLVTDVWAGLTLVHETEHLFDQVEGWEPSNPPLQKHLEHEVYAYLAEWSGVMHLSNGKYQEAVDSLIREMGVSSPDQILQMLVDDRRGPLVAVLEDRLGKVITTDAPKSEQEAGLRAAFYLITFMNRLGEWAEANGITPQIATSSEAIIYNVGAASGQ